MGYNFVGAEYEPGMVYEQLAKVQYDYVVGMDFGHGETMVYLYIQGENHPISLTLDGEYKVRSSIAVENGAYIIGKEACGKSNFRMDFKAPFHQWTTGVFTADKKLYTRGILMEGFLRELWKMVLRNPGYGSKLKEAVAEGKVLVTVGCPASSMWTNRIAMGSYRKMIRKATGCENVAVLPESNAAIMTTIMDAKYLESCSGRPLQMEQGVAIVDAGSSTIDFTFVLVGRKIHISSLKMGGYKLDELLLDQALEQNGLSRKNIPADQLRQLMVQIRTWKEEFYPRGESLGEKTLTFRVKNAPEGTEREITILFDREFVKAAMTEKCFSIGLSTSNSWLGHCANFVSGCLAMINKDADGTPLCDRLILTGGTSNVTDLVEAVKRQFPAEKIAYSEQRDACVARGLCYTKILESRGQEQMADFRENLENLKRLFYQEFTLNAACYLAEAVYNDLLEVIQEMESFQGEVTVGLLLDKANLKVRSNPGIVGVGKLEKEAAREIPEDETAEYHVAEWFQYAVKNAQTMEKDPETGLSGITESVNQVSMSIYGAQLNYVPQLAEVDGEDIAKLMQSVNLSKVINDAWLDALIPKLLSNLLTTVLGVFAMLVRDEDLVVAAISGILSALSAGPKAKRFLAKIRGATNKNKVLSPKKLQKIRVSLSQAEEREKVESKIALSLAYDLQRHNFLRKAFHTALENGAEIALGKVLFYIYED